MRHILIIAVMVFACGCGTVRYQVKKPTDGRRISTEVQWDVVELRFNDLWKALIKGE